MLDTTKPFPDGKPYSAIIANNELINQIQSGQLLSAQERNLAI